MTRENAVTKLKHDGFVRHQRRVDGTEIYTRQGYWFELRADGFRMLKPSPHEELHPFESLGECYERERKLD